MGQTLLLPDCAVKDHWQPVVPPFRQRPLARIIRWRPLAGQLMLPGMGPPQDASGVTLTPDKGDSALGEERVGGDSSVQAICPNCGGREFDADGDCTSCWEPAVVKPIARKRER